MTSVQSGRLAEMLGRWRSPGPANEQLAATLRALILDGRLPLETRLPAERGLAAELDLSRTTVSAAYDRLRDEGYVASRQGSGSWTTLPAGHRAASDGPLQPAGVDLRVAALPAPPALAGIAADAAAEMVRWLDHHGYDPLGLPPLREAVAAQFSARGLPTRAEQILITNGALHALHLIALGLVGPRQRVLAEIPTYPSALDALRSAGARLRVVPVTAEGWDIDALGAVSRDWRPQLAYLVPDFHNPTGALMDERTRAEVAHLLRRSETLVVVDETFVHLGLDVAPMLPSLGAFLPAPRCVVIGSLSKAVWGGLRIGWVRAEPPVIHQLAATRARVDLASPVLDQLVALHVLREFDHLMAERRALVRRRRATLLDALREWLPGWRVVPPSGGLVTWAELPDPVSTRLSVRARDHGIHLTPGPRFGSAGLLERFLRLPFTLPPDTLTSAVSTLARLAPATAAAPAPDTYEDYVA